LNVVGVAETLLLGAAATVEVGAATVAVELPVGATDAEEVGTVEDVPAHLAYAAFAALETMIWNSPMPLLC